MAGFIILTAALDLPMQVYAIEDEDDTGYEEEGESEELVTAETYYVDSLGRVPFLFRYKSRDYSKKYTVSINVAGVGRSYDFCFYSYGDTDYTEIYNFGETFNVKSGDTVNVNVKINDGSSNVIDENRTIKIAEIDLTKYYAKPDYHFRRDKLQALEGYPGWLEESGFALPAGYKQEDMDSARVVKNGKTYMKAACTYRTEFIYDLYPTICHRTRAYDYRADLCTIGYPEMYAEPEAGDYDVIFKTKNGDEIKFENCFHVTAKPVVTEKELKEVSEKYVYVTLKGSGISANAVCPEICDETGKVYTSFAEYKTVNNVYKLKKNADWDEIGNAKTGRFYIRIKGDCIDRTLQDEPEWRVRDTYNISIMPGKAIYNRKTNSVEFCFYEYSEKDGTELAVDILKGDVCIKKGSIKFKSGEKVSFPLDAPLERDCGYRCSLSIPGYSAGTDISNEWYNYDRDSVGMNRDTAAVSGNIQTGALTGVSIRVGSYYTAPLATLKLCVDVPVGQYTEGDLYAVIGGTSERIVIPYGAKGVDCDSFFTDWNLKTALPEGNYKLYINDKSGVLNSTDIYVRDSSKFYLRYISAGIDSEDRTKAYIYFETPHYDGQAPESAEGCDIKLYDADGKQINSAAIKFEDGRYNISGLDGKTYLIYAKITKDGKEPLNLGSMEPFWIAGELGYPLRTGGQRVLTGFLSENKELHAIYGVYVSDWNGVENVSIPQITPVTLAFYEYGYILKSVKRIEISSDRFVNGRYIFTKEDLSGLEKDGIYECEMSWDGCCLYGETGYFAADYVEPPEEPEVIPVTGVTITQGSEATLTISNTVETLQLEAVVTPENATNKSVSFNSSNPRVAVVDEKGLVTPVSDGDAVIKVVTEDGGFSAAITIHVQIKFPVTLKKNKKTSVSGTLIFKTNGAEQKPTELFKIDKSGKKASLTKVTKKGYVFKGWYTTTASGKQKKITSVTAKTLAKYPDGLVLEAKFVPGTYTVKYTITKPEKKVKVKVSPKLKAKKYKYTDENGSLTAITIEGTQLQPKDPAYKLLGWTTVKNGNEVMFKVGETVTLDKLVPVKGKNIRLYPVWGR